MPHLVKVYIRQVAIGFAISAAFVTMLLFVNVANLGALVLGSPIGWLACLMLWIFNGIVFAGVQFALALPKGHGEDDDSGGKPAATDVLLAEPIRVRQTDR
jgi:hypothetical protein